MPFWDLANKRFDELKKQLSVEHYMDIVYHARRRVSRWHDLIYSQTIREMITDYAMNEARYQTKAPTRNFAT